MKKNKLKLSALLLLTFTSSSFGQYGQINVDDYIQNAEVFEENQLPLLPTLISYGNFQDASTKPESESGFYQSLNGQWKFRFENTPYIFSKDFHEKNFDDVY